MLIASLGYCHAFRAFGQRGVGSNLPFHLGIAVTQHDELSTLPHSAICMGFIREVSQYICMLFLMYLRNMD